VHLIIKITSNALNIDHFSEFSHQ